MLHVLISSTPKTQEIKSYADNEFDIIGICRFNSAYVSRLTGEYNLHEFKDCKSVQHKGVSRLRIHQFIFISSGILS